MHQLEAWLLESQGMDDAWMPDARSRLRQLEAIFEQGGVKELGITLVDEEIDVICRRQRLLKADIAFPVTVANALLLKGAEESPDDCLARDGWSSVFRLDRFSFFRPIRPDRIVHLDGACLVTHRS